MNVKETPYLGLTRISVFPYARRISLNVGVRRRGAGGAALLAPPLAVPEGGGGELARFGAVQLRLERAQAERRAFLHGQAVVGISNLIGKSLVTCDGAAAMGRWRLLETIRAYDAGIAAMPAAEAHFKESLAVARAQGSAVLGAAHRPQLGQVPARPRAPPGRARPAGAGLRPFCRRVRDRRSPRGQAAARRRDGYQSKTLVNLGPLRRGAGFVWRDY